MAESRANTDVWAYFTRETDRSAKQVENKNDAIERVERGLAVGWWLVDPDGLCVCGGRNVHGRNVHWHRCPGSNEFWGSRG